MSMKLLNYDNLSMWIIQERKTMIHLEHSNVLS